MNQTDSPEVISIIFSERNRLLRQYSCNLSEKLKGNSLFIQQTTDHGFTIFENTKKRGRNHADALFFLDVQTTEEKEKQIANMLAKVFEEDGHVRFSKGKFQSVIKDLADEENELILLLLHIFDVSQVKNKRVFLMYPEKGVSVKYLRLFHELLKRISVKLHTEFVVFSSSPLFLVNKKLLSVTYVFEEKGKLKEIKFLKKQLRTAFKDFTFTNDLALAMNSDVLFIVETQAQALALRLLLEKRINEKPSPTKLSFLNYYILNLEALPLKLILALFSRANTGKEVYAIVNKEKMQEIFEFYQESVESKPPFKGSFEKRISWLRDHHFYLFKTNFEVDLMYNNEKTVLQVLKKHFYLDYEKIKKIPRSKPEYRNTLLKVLRQKRNEFGVYYVKHARFHELPLSYQLLLNDIDA